MAMDEADLRIHPFDVHDTWSSAFFRLYNP